MGKILSWVILAIAGWLAWRLAAVIKRKAEALRREGEAGGAGTTRRDGAAGTDGSPHADGRALRDERIVPCAHCGVHFPASEAVSRDGRLYCCPEHRDADARAA